MSVSAGTEQEFKFDVDADFDPPDLRPVVGQTVRLPEVEHRTVYFDTPDRRLWDRGITLRYRTVPGASGGGLAGGHGGAGMWTLKLPVAEDRVPVASRPDLSERSELSWEGTADQVPEPVRRILTGVARRARLTQIAELSAVRRRLLLRAPDAGEAWAEVDDDLVSVTAGPNAGRRFRQIEVELSGPAPPAGHIDAVLDQMRRAGASPGGGSKLGAALGLAGTPERGSAPSGAGRPSGPAGGKRQPLDQIVSIMLTADLDAVLACDVRLRRAAEDDEQPSAELIHAARVAFRRLRAHLRTLDPVLDPVWVRHVRADLKTVGQALGRVRDADVLLGRLRGHDDPQDRDGLDELIHLVSADRALAASELAPLMSATTYLDLLDRVASATRQPPFYSAGGEAPPRLETGPVMRDLVARRWRRVTEEIAGLGDHPGPQDLHRVRIRAKRLRYAAEAAAPFIGRDGRKAAKRAKALQDVLGRVRDSDSAVSWLRQLGSHPSITPTAAFVAGRIAGQEEAAARSLGPDWPRAATRLAAKRLRAAFA